MSEIIYPITVYQVERMGRISSLTFDNARQTGGINYIEKNKFVIRYPELYDDTYHRYFLTLTEAKESAMVAATNLLKTAQREVRAYKQIIKDINNL